jgi:hypothetical protein
MGVGEGKHDDRSEDMDRTELALHSRVVSRQVEPSRDAPDPRTSYVVFSQSPEARLDIHAWNAHAARFFATRLGLTEGDRLVVAPPGGMSLSASTRTLVGRPREAADLMAAQAADPSCSGLSLLARRCPVVWLVVRESDDDALALWLASILSSALLGPVLDTRGPELFGAKTAREKAERALGFCVEKK